MFLSELMNGKNLLYLLITLTVFAIGGALLYSGRDRPVLKEPVREAGRDTAESPAGTDGRPAQVERTESPRTHNTSPPAGEQPGLRETNRYQEEPVRPHEPDSPMNNPFYRAKLLKEHRIRYYENSPARDTPECEKIRLLLAEEGVGVDAVGDAYNAAWDYWSRQKEIDAIPDDKGTLGQLNQIFFDSAAFRLKHKYGITNEAFYGSLLEIQPRVFFGVKPKITAELAEELLAE